MQSHSVRRKFEIIIEGQWEKNPWTSELYHVIEGNYLLTEYIHITGQDMSLVPLAVDAVCTSRSLSSCWTLCCLLIALHHA